MMTGLHLWEVKHPYYATEGCYFASGSDQPHLEFNSWKEFLEENEDSDMNYNLVYRWDWREAGPDWELEADQLQIFTIQQRKALPMSYFVTVDKSDEADVLRWLTPRARRIAELWTPIWQAGAA